MDSTSSTAWEYEGAADRLGSSSASCSGTSDAGVDAAARPAESNSAPGSISRDVGRRSHQWSAGSRHWLRAGLCLLLLGSMATCTLAHTAPPPFSSSRSYGPVAPPASQVHLACTTAHFWHHESAALTAMVLKTQSCACCRLYPAKAGYEYTGKVQFVHERRIGMPVLDVSHFRQPAAPAGAL